MGPFKLLYRAHGFEYAGVRHVPQGKWFLAELVEQFQTRGFVSAETSKCKASTLAVYISLLRTYFKDTGIPYTIENEFGTGVYRLIARAEPEMVPMSQENVQWNS